MAGSNWKEEMTQYRTTGNRILAQADIEEMIANDMKRLEDATYEYSDQLEAEAEAAVTFKRKSARMFQTASGSVRDKEAFATIESIEEYEEYEKATAKAKAKREILRMLHARLESARSLNANVRNQV